MGLRETWDVIWNGKMGASKPNAQRSGSCEKTVEPASSKKVSGTNDTPLDDCARTLVSGDYRYAVRKTDDGTSRATITEYLGDAEEVIVPTEIDGVVVDGIGEKAFLVQAGGNQRLERVFIPDTVTNIGTRAFAGCVALKQVRLPDEIDVLGAGAFEKCGNLETVNIPKTIRKWLGATPFAYCDKLPGSIVGSNVFMPWKWIGGEERRPDAKELVQLETFLRTLIQEPARYEESLAHLEWSPATIELYGFDEVQGYDRNTADAYIIEFRKNGPMVDLQSALLQSLIMTKWVEYKSPDLVVFDNTDLWGKEPIVYRDWRLEPTLYDDSDRRWADMPLDQRRALAKEITAESNVSEMGSTFAENLVDGFERLFESRLTEDHRERIKQIISSFSGAELAEIVYQEWAGRACSWIGFWENRVLVIDACWLFD